MALVFAFLEILRSPTIGDMILAVFVGVLLGWVWKPKWANLNVDFLDCALKRGEKLSNDSLFSYKMQMPSCISWINDFGLGKENCLREVSIPDDSSLKLENGKSSLVNKDDFTHLYKLVEEKDGGPTWIQMMDRSTQNMSYQAWRRDTETGPPQYRSRTIYEDATPETLRDFFWDDEFRAIWDDMLLHAQTMEKCPTTGTMMVHWVRKFPFFCSDREYIIGRRIWDSGRTYYCVTKSVPCSSVPRRNKPRRVDLYYSSWCIRAAESKRDGQLTSCEVLLFHHEDMGIPWEIAKLGVRQGMWGAVKKIDSGFRAYQKHRLTKPPLSPCAMMAQINSKVSPDSLEESSNGASEIVPFGSPENSPEKGKGVMKTLVVGGAVVLACTLDRGLLTKAVIFGVARRFIRTGRKL